MAAEAVDRIFCDRCGRCVPLRWRMAATRHRGGWPPPVAARFEADMKHECRPVLAWRLLLLADELVSAAKAAHERKARR